MSDPALGLTMLALIVIVIMMGFPTAFTLMGLGMFFGYIALYDPSHPWLQNRIFDLMVERTYGAMNNDTLISIPLFVLMGYVMERGALVDKMFYSIQLAFRRVPASLAVATLIVCTFWGIASGLVGAVVVLMGVIAFNPMLKAGYDVKLDLRFLFTRQLSIMGSYMGIKDELRTVLKLVANGRLSPVVDKVWPLDDCIAAHTYLEKGKQFGKVVLRID